MSMVTSARRKWIAVEVKPFTLRSLKRRSFSLEKARSTKGFMRLRVLLLLALPPFRLRFLGL